jgi:hypothetical protein
MFLPGEQQSGASRRDYRSVGSAQPKSKIELKQKRADYSSGIAVGGIRQKRTK